jgi:glycosyltransferase involved in cell wall biosynthesis
MRIAIVTDAWSPQTNGVVTTLQRTVADLKSFGHDVRVLNPQGSWTMPCPTYPEIRLAPFSRARVRQFLDEFSPDALHIATEGPLGIWARAYAVGRGRSFTTSYHTQFPQYIRARLPIPEAVTYAHLRCFHARATRVMVGTEEMRRDLRRHGFRRVVPWTRGVDTTLFHPSSTPETRAVPELLYVGRVSVEKSVEDFCRLDLPSRKVVVGDGPDLVMLRRRYPEVEFRGYLYGEALAAAYRSADCFVFASRTDTFGLVMLEAMASGVPVAAYPVTGPLDVVQHGVSGCLDHDLRAAVLGALSLDRTACRRQALEYSWERASRQFESNLVEFRTLPARRAAKRQMAAKLRPNQRRSPTGQM